MQALPLFIVMLAYGMLTNRKKISRQIVNLYLRKLKNTNKEIKKYKKLQKCILTISVNGHIITLNFLKTNYQLGGHDL